MKKHNILPIWIVVFVLYALCLPAFAAAPMIEKIRFMSSGDRIDEVTFKLNGPHLPKSFALKGDRPRVVFDFPDTTASKAVQNIMETKGNFISHIRIGIHRGDNPKTRVVFDLIPGQEIDFQQDFDSGTNTLTIRIHDPGIDLPIETAPTAAESHPETVQEPAAAPAGKPDQKASPAPPDKTAEIITPQDTEPSPQKETEATTIKPLAEIGEAQASDPARPPVLESIEFDKNSNRGEIIIFKLTEFNPPVVFGIEEDIPRIVCFFKDTSPGETLKDHIDSNGRFVKAIKIGKYRNPDNVRVVLDLVPGSNYDLQQVFFKEDHLFMIIINTTGVI